MNASCNITRASPTSNYLKFVKPHQFLALQLTRTMVSVVFLQPFNLSAWALTPGCVQIGQKENLWAFHTSRSQSGSRFLRGSILLARVFVCFRSSKWACFATSWIFMICFGLEELICNVYAMFHHGSITRLHMTAWLGVLCQGFFAGSNWIIQGWEFMVPTCMDTHWRIPVLS